MLRKISYLSNSSITLINIQTDTINLIKIDQQTANYFSVTLPHIVKKLHQNFMQRNNSKAPCLPYTNESSKRTTHESNIAITKNSHHPADNPKPASQSGSNSAEELLNSIRSRSRGPKSTARETNGPVQLDQSPPRVALRNANPLPMIEPPRGSFLILTDSLIILRRNDLRSKPLSHGARPRIPTMRPVAPVAPRRDFFETTMREKRDGKKDWERKGSDAG